MTDFGNDLLQWTTQLLGLSLLIQNIEHLRLSAYVSANGFNSARIQGSDWVYLPTLIARALALLSHLNIYRAHIILRIGLSIVLLVGFHPPSVLWTLFVGSTLINLRWRGAFNGGSDFMTLVVLVGSALSATGLEYSNDQLFRLGLWSIALFSLTSYVVSGAVKLKAPEWRNGSALTVFLDQGLYGPLSAHHWFRHPFIARALSWAFILFECSIVFCLQSPAYMIYFFTGAILFHGLVFWYLGLNRFIFAWVSSFPALYYASIQLSLLFGTR